MKFEWLPANHIKAGIRQMLREEAGIDVYVKTGRFHHELRRRDLNAIQVLADLLDAATRLKIVGGIWFR